MSQTKDIPTIAFAGGPLGAKSTIIARVRQMLEELGWTVFVQEEMATRHILNGVKPSVIGGTAFQKLILQSTLRTVAEYRESASQVPNDKVVILCDRGAADGWAYMDQGEFSALIASLGLNTVDLRDRHYTAVIFLQSLAHDNPTLYDALRFTNPARMEAAEQARILNERTLAAWNGHPHMQIIGNSQDGIKEKVRRAFQAVCRVLGIPVPIEIERKYLIDPQFDMGSIPPPTVVVDICQHYLSTTTPGEPGMIHEERMRARGQEGAWTYYHTIKRDIRPGIRHEIERPITPDEWRASFIRKDPSFGTILKKRYCFPWLNQICELDVFSFLPGLKLLEIELTEEHDRVTIPPFLEGLVTDVTDNPEYSNRAIARQLKENARRS